MSKDLYKILGVKKDADKQTIKKAYRKKSMTSHPDTAEGSPEKFALVKRAHDVLMDDKRRKQYDETGNMDDAPVENGFSDIGNILAQIFDSVLQACAKEGQTPLELDMVESMMHTIDNAITEFRKQERIMSNILSIDKKLKGRFKRKRKKNDINFMEKVIGFRIQQVETNLNRLSKHIKDHQEAREKIAEYVFDFDEPEPTHRSGIDFNFIRGGSW